MTYVVHILAGSLSLLFGYVALYSAKGATLHLLQRSSALVFFIEAFAVWAFAAYWVSKSREMRETSAERLALEGNAARIKDQAGIVPAN